MHYENKVAPTQDQIRTLSDENASAPIFMVNLLKFKEKAEYPDGRETNLSGREAYAIYGAEVVAHLAKVGGQPVFMGDVSQLLLGEVEELWDQVAIAMYPSRAKMLEMVMDADYQQSAVHREAGLAGQLNIETTGLGPVPLATSE